MADAHKNFAYSTVATAPSPATSGTSLVLASGGGALFPAAPFNVTIWPSSVQALSSNSEIARCTAKSTDTLTIVRAQEGSSARSVVVGDQIAATITTKTLTDVETAAIHDAADYLIYPISGGYAYKATSTGVETTGSEPGALLTACMAALGTTGGTIQFLAGNYAWGSTPSITKSLTGWLRIKGTGGTLITLATGTAGAVGGTRFLDCTRSADYDTFRFFEIDGFTIDAAGVTAGGGTIAIGNAHGSNDQRVNIDHVIIGNIRTLNLIDDDTGAIGLNSISFSSSHLGASEATQTHLSQIYIHDCELNGGNGGCTITAGEGDLVGINVFLDDIVIERVRHLIPSPAANFASSAHIQIGSDAKGGRVVIRDCYGKNSKDVGIEVDNVTSLLIENCQMDDSFSAGFYYTNFNTSDNPELQEWTTRNCFARRVNQTQVASKGWGFQVGVQNSLPHSVLTYEDCFYIKKTASLVNDGEAGFYIAGIDAKEVNYIRCRYSADDIAYTSATPQTVTPWRIATSTTSNPRVNIRDCGYSVSGSQGGGAGNITVIGLRLGGTMRLSVDGFDANTAMTGAGLPASHSITVDAGDSTMTASGTIRRIATRSISGTAPIGVRIRGTALLTIPNELRIEECDFSAFPSGGTEIQFATAPQNQTKVFTRANIGRSGQYPIPSSSISPTGSPFTYQNVDSFSERVTVQGGTVTVIAIASSLGTFITTGVTQGAFILENGDQIKVTYSGAPTMTKLPMR